jgi:hypothetical protein
MGRLGQVTCGAVGFAVAVGALAVSYPVVVAVTSVLPLLSTTAIVFVWAFVWLFTWLALVVGLSLVRSRVGAATTA